MTASDSKRRRPAALHAANKSVRPQRRVAIEGASATISRRAADRLRAGHVWVYRSDVVEIPDDAPLLLPVVDHRGILLGTALYSPASEIALRLVSTELIASEAEWLALLGSRLRVAITKRKEILSSADTNACRLVFSEADELPGIIVDQYGELVILQLLAKALDNEAVRIVVAKALQDTLDPATIVERPDPRIRELEQLNVALDGAPLYVRGTLSEPLTRTLFRLNGLNFHYDAGAGQKTGAFLDQRENYAAAARYAHGEALDVCTYQGGFALHLAKSCPRVTGIDVSRSALEVAERNLGVNRGLLKNSEVDWVEANAFDLLRDWSDSGAVYDTIVLDPPAFAKSKRAVESALRGYKELNLRALRMLRPGGILVTCSCSHHVSLADFTAVVASAAGDARRRVRLLERRGAAADHPVVLTIPETEYLKCLVCVAE
ncbi:MAG TPA: class I SAM-dependent rRNA methyltransferase [Silvibacterium sp.]|nr:class I SAM-dependent rRNA methyltransferase [Silvibacterium sp.]